MVYLSSVWGMGETKSECHNTNSSSSFLQENDEEVALLPLKNQVGGHTRLLLLNQNTICKPLNCKELDFYQNIPQDIQIFVPKFKGYFKLPIAARSHWISVTVLALENKITDRDTARLKGNGTTC